MKLGKGSTNIMGALYKGLIVTGVLTIGGLAIAVQYALPNGFGELTGAGAALGLMAPDGTTPAIVTGMDLFLCGVAGLVVTALIVVVTEYYTGVDYRPVKSVAEASTSGHGTNVIQGLAVSLESTALPAITIMAGIILTAAGLGFLGLGAQPPLAEWGAMIASGRDYLLDQWWVPTIPGIAILVVSLGFNLLGDGLRDVLDPRSSGGH